MDIIAINKHNGWLYVRIPGTNRVETVFTNHSHAQLMEWCYSDVVQVSNSNQAAEIAMEINMEG